MVESMTSSATGAAPSRLKESGTGQPVSPSSAPFQSPRTQTLLLCLLLTVLTLAFYNPVIRNGFIYDDDGYITNNPQVKSGLTWQTVKWAFTTYQQANWHPLTWLSHAIDCEIFGLNPAGPHYVNVLLHALNAVLLFLLLQRATGFRWRSLMVAALFALHPINVESVAWASERKNVLSTLFFLLALYAYGEYARKPAFSRPALRSALIRYAAVAGWFALALLCKPQVITFPFLLLLWDYWPLCRVGAPVANAAAPPNGNAQPSSKLSIRWLILEKLPLLLLSAASAFITMKAQRAGGAVKAFSEYSFLLRLETAVISYARYIWQAVWPANLVALYPHPTRLYPDWEILAASALLILITARVVRAQIPGGTRMRGQSYEQRYLAVGWLWFLGSLVPMIGLVQVGLQAMADRYAYVSFLGLFLMAIWLVADWAKANRIPAAGLAAAAILWLLTLGTLTYRQVGYWHDTQSFWQRTLALTDDNYVAEDNLGEFLFNAGKNEEAVAHFRAALAIRPDDPAANLNLGTYEDRRANLPAAIEYYQAVARHAGDLGMRAMAYGSLGFVYRQMGQPATAKQSFEMAVQIAPDRSRAMIGLGLIAQDNGHLEESIRQYSHALSVQPSEVTYLLLAHALQQEGHLDEARAVFAQVANSPNLRDAEQDAQMLLARK
jgi:protein O-mannosyl-transferase